MVGFELYGFDCGVLADEDEVAIVGDKDRQKLCLQVADSHIQGYRPVSSTRIWLSPRMESPGNAAAAIRNVQAIGLRDSW